jgi:diketogulonate reductase-like aldo/keto reductase
MILKETYTLSNGLKIPKVGLGTWFISNKNAPQAVKDAVDLGYRLIDTAQAYNNEAGVGEGIRTCGIPRKDLFVTSKVHAKYKSYESAMASIDESLEKMGLDYIDMMIIHAPQPWTKFRKKNRYFKENIQVWKALEDAYKAGKVKAIGVSNFLEDDLENILHNCDIKPMVNQILAHIGNAPLELIDFCEQNNILVEAYSPIAHGKALKNKEIIKMAEKYNVSVPQLCIRYVLELGTVALPKTANPDHMKDNAGVDFKISKEDMKVLNNASPVKYGALRVFPVYSGKDQK